MWNLLGDISKGTISATIGSAIVLVGLLIGGWWWFSQPTPLSGPSPSLRQTNSVTITSGSDITFTDSSGTKKKFDKPSNAGEIDQSINIEPSDTTRRLFVEKNRAWFPEITNSPSVVVRGLGISDTQGITSTTRGTPLIDFHWKRFFIGGSYVLGGGPSLTLAYHPIRIWAFRFGPGLHIMRDQDGVSADLHLQTAVEVKEHLHFSLGVNPDVIIGEKPNSMSFGLTYEF